MAGMLAARVLADTFEHVTIIERHVHDLAESMESGPQDHRPGAAAALPQVLSERSRPQLERLFPDLSAELTADGAAIVVPVGQTRPARASELGADRDGARLQFTHRFIQRHLSRRLTSSTPLRRCAVAIRRTRERGWAMCWRTDPAANPKRGSPASPADLVVDAMGAGIRLCVWLDDIWRIRVPTEQEQITSHYASRRYRLPAARCRTLWFLILDLPIPIGA